MIERIWFGRSLLYLFLLPFSWLYGVIIFFRRSAYRIGLFASWRSPIPVVIVGNLTVGGNGKTPFVIWLVEMLQQKGVKVGVVSRGYGGKATCYPLVLNKQTSTQEAGDEAVLIFQRTGVPIAVSADRSAAVKALLQQQPLDIIITDDGLQHYALQRDLELVVIDGIRRFGNGWWLPAGPMRERATRLDSVDAIVVNGGNAKENEILMTLQANLAINLFTGEKKKVTELVNVVAMAGIGHPARFFTMLKQLKVSLVKCYSFADHKHYELVSIKALTCDQQSLVMTEKDAVKCRAFAQKNWWYLPVDAQLREPQASQLLAKIFSITHNIIS